MTTPIGTNLLTLSKTLAGAPYQRIKDAAAVRGVDFGMAVRSAYLTDSVTGPMVISECSVLIPEFEMQPSVMQPNNTLGGANAWDYTAMDAIAAFAASHSMKLHGHAGFFHAVEILPQWMEDILAVPNEANCRALITNRLEGIAARGYNFTHFQVFNEVLGTAGGYRTSSPWYVCWGGPGYITFACQEARRVLPGVLLGGNDYAFEYAQSAGNDAKRAQALTLAADLKSQGLIDFWGSQTHIQAAASYQSSLEQTWRPWLASMRAIVPVLLTEVDFLNQATRATNEELDAYAQDRMKRIVGTWAEGLQAGEQLVVWGIKDDLSWLQQAANQGGITQQRPLPWDSNGNPKTMERMLRRIFA